MDVGYEKTTMRAISQKTGITVGNLYRYYENKLAIFEAIVEPVFANTIGIITGFENFVEVGFEKFSQELVVAVGGLYKQYRDEMIIILKGSAGTKYADAIDIFKAIVIQRANELKHNSDILFLSEADKLYNIEIVSGAFIDTVIRLLVEQNTYETFIKWFSISLTIFFKDVHQRAYIAHTMAQNL
jgi:AcrR family transcriptional regulator